MNRPFVRRFTRTLRRLCRVRLAAAAAPLLPFAVRGGGGGSGHSGGGGRGSRRPPPLPRPSPLLLGRLRTVGTAAAVVWALRSALRAATPTTPEAAAAIVAAAVAAAGARGGAGGLPRLAPLPSEWYAPPRERSGGGGGGGSSSGGPTPTPPPPLGDEDGVGGLAAAVAAAARPGGYWNATCDESPPSAYAFVHLHKTGGNSLKVGLTGWAHRNGLELLPTCHPSRFADARWDPTPALVGRPRRAVAGADTVCDLGDVARRARAAAPTVPDLVVGHGAGALGRVLPRGAATVRLFTLLRSPLARKLSHYRHFEAGAPDGGAPTVGVRTATADNASTAAAADASLPPPASPLPALVAYLLTRNRAYMTKRLAGWGGTSELATAAAAAAIDAVPGVGRAALRAAAATLVRSYFFVGTQEAYAAGACVLAAQLNGACWGGRSGVGVKRLLGARLAGTHENVRGGGGGARGTAAAAAAAAGVSPALATEVAQVEVLDGALYALATALLEEKLRWYPECQVEV
ncbi:hypothetical protein I4F81_008260 [Pyropia yezoensis]|uniref:Uncharacterized protein n=1 Tax=Pyropia yezoensis TaxID=2788 RepID=A0ACC3C6J2_PYRYE|nr:hypothetical protein I4F81_008260 [Neopyropia yezoensis]